DPLVELVQVGSARARSGAPLRSGPALHGGPELAGERAGAGIEIEVGLLRIENATESQVSLAPVLERIGIARRDRHRPAASRGRLAVSRQCIPVVGEFWGGGAGGGSRLLARPVGARWVG